MSSLLSLQSRPIILLIECVTILFLLGLYGYMLSKSSYRSRWGKNLYIWCAGAIFIAGTIINMWGYYYHCGWILIENDLFAPITRSAISSLEMFISETHIEEMKEAEHDVLWMFCYMLCYCLALITSMFMIFELFFKRQKSKDWLNWNLKKNSNKRWFIFFGIDRHSLMLAKDIDLMFDKKT